MLSSPTSLQDYFPETLPNGLEWPHTQLLAVKKHRLLFNPIAKNACSTLKRLMVTISDIPHKELILGHGVHSSIDHYRTGIKLLDLSIEQARQIMDGQEYFKFVVIRDPFERLVSTYLEKFVINRKTPGNQHHTGPVIAAIQGNRVPDFNTGISFASFIEFITEQAPETLDPHWIPQVQYLRGVHYDRVYRMDELNLLRDDLSTRIGQDIRLEHRNRSQLGPSRLVKYAATILPGKLYEPNQIDKLSFMDSEIMFRIINYFAEDYRLYYPGKGPMSRSTMADSQKGNRPTRGILNRLTGYLPKK